MKMNNKLWEMVVVKVDLVVISKKLKTILIQWELRNLNILNNLGYKITLIILEIYWELKKITKIKLVVILKLLLLMIYLELDLQIIILITKCSNNSRRMQE
jgi:hypothetical protein